MKPYNFIYIHSHDTGRFIQPYGYGIPTPNLMKLATQGTLFRQAYCAGPTCSPSRAALLTGMSSHACGMTGLTHRGFQLKDAGRHIAHFMKGQGYETILSGIQHETSGRPEQLGYMTHLTEKKKNGTKKDQDYTAAQQAAEYLTTRKDAQPFFMSVGFFYPHRDFISVAENINPNYVTPPYPMHDNPETRKDMAAYMSSAQFMDECVGILMNALRDSKLEDNTIVIYTTDHGIAFPKMKSNLFDTGIGVSMIMKLPGFSLEGVAVESLVSHLDVFPTICEIIGASKPDWLEGRSMLPLFQGASNRIRDEIFAEISYHASYEPARCIRTERYKLIRYFDDYDHFVYANTDDGASKDFLLQSGWAGERRDHVMLFDLYLDPVERENRVGRPEYLDIYNDLSGRLLQWMADTNDPLLNGKVPKPEGARINLRTAVSNSSKVFE